MASLSKKIKVGLLIAVPVVLIGAGVWFFANGYVKVGSPASIANQSEGKCGSLIGRYNEAYGVDNRDASADIIKESAAAAAKIEGNESDPNCVFIRYTAAYTTRNVAESNRLAGIIKELSENGKYITGRFANPQGVNTIVESAKFLEQNNPESSETPTNQGNG